MDKTKSVDINIGQNIDGQEKISGWTRKNQWISTLGRILMNKTKSVDIKIGQNIDGQDKISGYQERAEY